MKHELSARLSMLARLHPAIYDVIGHAPSTVGDIRSLNGQPTPPRDLAMLLATASTAAAVTQSAILASALGLDHRNVVFEAVKGWCGNEPRVIPWPTTWPFPFPWPEPDPEPWYRIEDIRLTAALVLHDVALRMHPDSDVRATLMEGAFELADSAGI